MSSPKPPRPTFFEDTANDRLTAIITALTTELAGLTDRVATLEALLNDAGVLAPGAVDHHVLTDEQQAARRARHAALTDRVFYVLQEEVHYLAEQAGE
ncbi:hypothetical protein [Brevundimonas faecalis]|uniref:Uncharacterized protein n=1 Tax=Brevundimonas faecalis TaxID=947378 RepID=A0ABV2R9W6_9CAUL